MSRTLSTILTTAAVAGCVLAGSAAVATVITIDDSPGRTEAVEPVRVTPTQTPGPAPLAAAPVDPAPAPTPVPTDGRAAPIAPSAPRELPQHPVSTPTPPPTPSPSPTPTPVPSPSAEEPDDGSDDDDERGRGGPGGPGRR